MRMYIKSVVVDDQDKALAFYTGMLGFSVRHDIPMGPFRWITLVSEEEPDGVELALEPNEHPAVRTCQETLKAEGIPWTAFSVDDLEAEASALKARGVTFTQEPTRVGDIMLAVIDDTCGNLIQLIQLSA